MRKIENDLKNEVDNTAEQLILHRMNTITASCHNLFFKDRLNYVMSTYTKRFVYKSQTPSMENWTGIYYFSYGDLIYDNKCEKDGIVVNETNNYITVWYFRDKIPFESNRYNIRNCNKHDTKLIVMKRSELLINELT